MTKNVLGLAFFIFAVICEQAHASSAVSAVAVPQEQQSKSCLLDVVPVKELQKIIVGYIGDRWKLHHRYKLMNDRKEPSPIADMAFSLDSKYLAAGGSDANIHIWTLATTIPIIFRTKYRYNLLAYSPRGNQIAITVGTHIDLFTLFLSHGPHKILQGSNTQQRTRALAYCPSGTHIAQSIHNEIKIWDVASGILVNTLKHPCWVASMAYTPDGSRLIAAGGESVTIWDIKTGIRLKTVTCGNPGYYSFAHSADRQYLATVKHEAGSDHYIKIVDLETGLSEDKYQQPRVREDYYTRNNRYGHDEELCIVKRFMAYSPNGAYLATISCALKQSKLQIWNTRSGDCIFEEESGFEQPYGNVVYSPDGRYLAVSQHDIDKRDLGGNQIVVYTNETLDLMDA